MWTALTSSETLDQLVPRQSLNSVRSGAARHQMQWHSNSGRPIASLADVVLGGIRRGARPSWIIGCGDTHWPKPTFADRGNLIVKPVFASERQRNVKSATSALLYVAPSPMADQGVRQQRNRESDSDERPSRAARLRSWCKCGRGALPALCQAGRAPAVDRACASKKSVSAPNIRCRRDGLRRRTKRQEAGRDNPGTRRTSVVSLK
jgi:hypothetical protein